jgi:tRNA(Ile)-lysidine synthase
MRQASAFAALDPVSIFADFDLAARPAVIAAVSGGSDSLSLLFLLQAFLKVRAPATRLVAVTVDHGLRAASAEEAASVAALCAARGIAHRTARWTGEKPSSGLPAAAREARYDLLAAAADAEGTDCVFTGHTLDDQLETVAMREARGEGHGLAGMAPATLFAGRAWILRPLLGLGRAELRAWLTERDIAWIDDPTNVDDRYERARVRMAREPATRAAGIARSNLAAAATARIALGKSAASIIRGHTILAAPGLPAFRLSYAYPANRHTGGVYALRMLLSAVGGTQHLPDLEASRIMFWRICTESFRGTLSRVVIEAAVPALYLRRERRSLPPPSRPPVGSLWDGRFRVVGELAPGSSIAPVGSEVARKIVRGSERPPFPVTPSDTSLSLVTEALAAEPGLWRDEEFVGLAADAGLVRRIVSPWARFLPSFDLAPAHAVAALIGADEPPKAPLARHNPGRG